MPRTRVTRARRRRRLTLPRPPPPPSRAQVVKFRPTTASGYAPAKKFKVGVLGATGAVGQRFLQYLEGHPWFEVTKLGASERSAGKAYEVATQWQLSADLPASVRGKKVVLCDPAAFGKDVDLVFSALVRTSGRGWRAVPVVRRGGGPHCGRVVTPAPTLSGVGVQEGGL